MSPNKVPLSAYEVELRRQQLKELKKKSAAGQINKSHERKPLENSKFRKLKPFIKEGMTPAMEFVKKESIGTKIKTQNKKKGQLKNGGKFSQVKEVNMDDEYETEEEMELPNNSQQIDEPMSGISGSDSIKEGRDVFSWLIAPIKPEEFFKTAWEKSPMHVKRTDYPHYYKDVLSSQKIHNVLRDNYVLFSKNIDVTSYRNGERETHNPTGRATPSVVWDFYKNGCSVRMLNPQTYCPELRKLNATLQEFFGCFVGANSYLTPANSQGFAPHYDDIEAFILQIEGKKHWKVYPPRTSAEILPRFSSPNFKQEELNMPILEVTLNPGDLLYFPRGFIHQASTEPGHHSLHVTISCYQKNTWGDLLEKLLPAAIAVAQEEDVEFRKGLPLNYLRHMGVSYSDSNSAERKEFFAHLRMLFDRLLKHAPVDAAVDQMGKQFMHDALPPVLTTDEEKCSVFSENNVKLNDDGSVSGSAVLKENTRIQLIRAHILRLIKEDESNDAVQVYHCVDNSLEYHGEDPMMFEITSDQAMAVEHLLLRYPEFVSVSEVPLKSQEERLELANLLWKKGLLLTEKPL